VAGGNTRGNPTTIERRIQNRSLQEQTFTSNTTAMDKARNVHINMASADINAVVTFSSPGVVLVNISIYQMATPKLTANTAMRREAKRSFEGFMAPCGSENC